MKKMALIVGASLLFSASAFGQIIDPEWKAVEQKMKQEQKRSCKNIKNMDRRWNCEGAIAHKYERNGDKPGTEEYVKKHYSHMSNAELNKFILQYDKKTKNCRSLYSGEKPLPGEITCKMASQTTTQLNFMLDVKGGGPNPFDQIFGKGTSFGSEHTW